jgi:haloalkane dehalogenase
MNHASLGLSLKTVTIAGGSVSYVDEGSGPPIVLLHGAPLTSLGFVRVIRELRHHYRVIAPDLPGFGYSEENPVFPGTLEGYALFVEQFCGALALARFFLYVNDSSGCFGIVAAARMEADVAGLVVADTVQLPLTGPAWIVKQVLKHVIASRFVRFLNRRFNLLAWAVATLAPMAKPFPRAERAVLVAQFDTADKRDRAINLFEQMGKDESFMNRAASLARERLARTPTLILYGQFDPMRLIGAGRRFRAIFQRSEEMTISFEEHFPILASGARVARAVHGWLVRTLAVEG